MALNQGFVAELQADFAPGQPHAFCLFGIMLQVGAIGDDVGCAPGVLADHVGYRFGRGDDGGALAEEPTAVLPQQPVEPNWTSPKRRRVFSHKPGQLVQGQYHRDVQAPGSPEATNTQQQRFVEMDDIGVKRVY